MNELRAFHGDPEVQATYLARIEAHAAADEIIHGTYWEKGKGCAVGCTVHSDDHSAYERELGIPRILAKLEGRIFEGMGNGEAKNFPAAFLRAIPLGADLSGVWDHFALWLMVDPQHGVRQYTKAGTPQAVAVERVATLFGRATQGVIVEREEWRAANAAANAAADAAAYAAGNAAAYAAGNAAAYAAADAAANAASNAAAYAASNAAAYAAARLKFYEAAAAKLIQLLAAAPVPVAA